MNKKKSRIFIAGVSILIFLYSIVPISWMIRTSLLEKSELYKLPAKIFNKNITPEYYKQILGIGKENILIARNFKDAFGNSIWIALAATICVCIIAILTGYVFARVNTKATNILFSVLLVTMVLPAYSVMLPLYRIMMKLQLLDTILGVTLIYISAFMPLAIWIMKSFFESIPHEIEESAWIDGASRFKSMCLIMPIAAPGIIATAIITFLSAWSQYAIPLVFASSDAQPLTVFLTTLNEKASVSFGLISAGGVLTIIPPIIIVICLNRYLLKGLTTGAIK